MQSITLTSSSLQVYSVAYHSGLHECISAEHRKLIENQVKRNTRPTHHHRNLTDKAHRQIHSKLRRRGLVGDTRKFERVHRKRHADANANLGRTCPPRDATPTLRTIVDARSGATEVSGNTSAGCDAGLPERVAGGDLVIGHELCAASRVVAP